MVEAIFNTPIGVFDSGLGGVSVLRQMRYLMPAEQFLYFVGSKTCKKGEKRPLQQGSNNDKQPHLQRTGTSFKEQDR